MSRPSIILETERLYLRELSFEDDAFIIELLNSPGWLKYIGDRNVKTLEQAREYLEKGPISSYSKHGYGLWLVSLVDSSIPVGICGILNRQELETPDIGYALLPEYYGQGYAREIVNATMVYAHESLKMRILSAIVQPDNTRSIALLMKQGFSFEKLFSFPGKTEVLQLFKYQVV